MTKELLSIANTLDARGDTWSDNINTEKLNIENKVNEITECLSSSKKARILTSQIVKKAKELEKESLLSLNPFLWLKSMIMLEDSRFPDRFSRIYDLGGNFSDYSLEDYQQNIFSPENNKETKKRLKLICLMFKSIKEKENQEGKVKFTLRRNRSTDNRSWDYIMIWYLEGGDKIIDNFNIVNRSENIDYPAYVCYEAWVACVNHAADILYKDFIDWIGYLDYVKYKDFLYNRSWWVDEFKDKETWKLQNNKNYVMSAFLWYYTNENRRFLIPNSFHEVFMQLWGLSVDRLDKEIDKYM